MAEQPWSANTRGLVAMTAARHAVTLGLGCNCGWIPNPDEPTGAGTGKSEWLQWAAHSADAILTALADARLLLPPGGETREERGCQLGHVNCDHAGLNWIRTVTTWPDGSTSTTAWISARRRPIDTEETNDR